MKRPHLYPEDLSHFDTEKQPHFQPEHGGSDKGFLNTPPQLCPHLVVSKETGLWVRLQSRLHVHLFQHSPPLL